MAGEEPCKMPELYVEALLEEHGLCKRPQAAMQSKSKRVRNLLPKKNDFKLNSSQGSLFES